MKEIIALQAVGYVRSSRKEVKDDEWDGVKVQIHLDETRFTPEALAGLSSFSHLEVIFFMDQVEEGAIQMSARHPRNNPEWPKVGIFSQRGKNRPNRLGLTVCRINSVEGLVVDVTGLDAVDGTPVLDIKPWVKEFAPRGEVLQPDWMTELMKNYWE